MIALDTKVLVRYLVNDHPQQVGAACRRTAELTTERRGFIRREVSVELARILNRAYGFSRNRNATVFEELATTRAMLMEAAGDTIRAVGGYRCGGPDLAEHAIVAVAKRSGVDTLYTLGQHGGQLRAAILSPEVRT